MRGMKGKKVKETITVIKCDNCQKVVDTKNGKNVLMRGIVSKGFPTGKMEIGVRLSVGEKEMDLSQRDFCDKDCMLKYFGKIFDQMAY
jgi:hypothetical protein